MNSIFAGLNIAQSSLSAQQRALEVTGHNIANVNTPGYSRQTAYLVTKTPSPDPTANRVNFAAGQVGTGVTVAAIQRARLDYIDRQIWEENCVLGENEQKSTMLQKMEAIINEPSDTGLRTIIGNFFDSLQELSKRPEDMDVRGVVRQRAIEMTTYFNQLHSQLTEMEGDLQYTLEEKVKDANEITAKIADLNAQIKKICAAGDTPNDLYDQRDALTEQLSSYMDINVGYDSFGQVMINTGGTAVVNGDQALTLKVEKDFSGPTADYIDATECLKLRWQETGNNVNLQSGEFKGLLDLNNYGDGEHKSVKYYLQEINKIAGEIVSTINNQQKQGYIYDSATTGGNFFENVDSHYAALQFKVDDSILYGDETGGGVWNIAAASTANLPGDGGNALLMAKIRNKSTSFNANWTQDDFLRNFITTMGVDGQQSQQMVDNQTTLIQQLQNSRDSVSAVSLDEEAMDMIKYQQAYNAASRMLTVVDGMIDVVVNKLGLVGR